MGNLGSGGKALIQVTLQVQGTLESSSGWLRLRVQTPGAPSLPPGPLLLLPSLPGQGKAQASLQAPRDLTADELPEAGPPSPPAATVAAAAVRMKDSRGKASRAAAQPSRSAWRVPGASHGRGEDEARIWQLEGKRGGWGPI